MKNMLRYIVIGLLLVPGLRAGDEIVSTVHGAVTKTDAAVKAAAGKAKQGTEKTIHLTESTAAKGADKTSAGAKDAYAGAKEGTEAVAHGTLNGTEKTDAEVRKIGKEGMTSAEGAVTKIGEVSKTAATKTADGTEHTFEVAEHGVNGAAVGIGKAAVETEKVAVHSVEETGKKVAHVFGKL
jgi:hypothetical protein